MNMSQHNRLSRKPDAAPEWEPTCSVVMLRVRAAMLTAVRTFFGAQGYLEVETPLLSRDIVVDANLEPFRVPCGQETWFLQTSPEAAMKRLLAAGSGSIFQITRSFRSGEVGARHNPEFTMLEWYGVDTDQWQQMQLTEELVVTLLLAASSLMDDTGPAHTAAAVPSCPAASAARHGARPFVRTAYDEAFRRHFGAAVLELDAATLAADALARFPRLPPTLTTAPKDDVLNAVLAEVVEPQLGRPIPEFLHSYPVSQAAQARVDASDPRTALRFELYINGLEICNGYDELTDAGELRRREDLGNQLRQQAAEQELPGAPRMLAAIRSGIPRCSGVALGFDRLVMIATGAETIEQVIPFPSNRA